MALPPPTPEELATAQEAVNKYGTVTQAARSLKMPRTTLRDWLNYAEIQPSRWLGKVKGREEVPITDGYVLIASDGHYWPGEPTTAHKAFVKFVKKFKPQIVVFNGDVLDAPTISRHPPIGWDHCPTLRDELDVCEERLNEIVKACPVHCKRYWPLGNHDGRFETRLAQAAPEFRGVGGMSLQDRFPDWEPCWSVFVGGDNGAVVKHRFKGGIHAAHNNTLWAGRTMITGHLHSLKVTPFSDYNGTRWGVDSGTLADPYHEAFQDYTEDSPKNWRSGFIVLTFKDGRLLWPEICHAVEPGIVEFRGELMKI